MSQPIVHFHVRRTEAQVIFSAEGLSETPQRNLSCGRRQQDETTFDMVLKGSVHPDHAALASLLCFWPWIPEKARLVFEDKPSEALIKRFHRHDLLGPDITCDTSDETYQGQPGAVHSVGGGFDSLASRILFPEYRGVTIIPSRRAMPNLKRQLKKDVELVPSNLQYMQERGNWPHWTSMLIPAMLRAGDEKLSGIITGSNTNGIYLLKGNRYREFLGTAWFGIFETVGTPMLPVVAGLSRLATAAVCVKRNREREARWCPGNGANCRACVKCLRSYASLFYLGASPEPRWSEYFDAAEVRHELSSDGLNNLAELRFLLHSDSEVPLERLKDFHQELLKPILSQVMWKLNPQAYGGAINFEPIGGGVEVQRRIEAEGIKRMSPEDLAAYQTLGHDRESPALMEDAEDFLPPANKRRRQHVADDVEILYIGQFEQDSEALRLLMKVIKGMWPLVAVDKKGIDRAQKDRWLKFGHDLRQKSALLEHVHRLRAKTVSLHPVSPGALQSAVELFPNALLVMPLYPKAKGLFAKRGFFDSRKAPMWKHTLQALIESRDCLLIPLENVEAIEHKGGEVLLSPENLSTYVDRLKTKYPETGPVSQTNMSLLKLARQR